MNSLRSYRYRVVDVFTEQSLEGNALVVFPDASGLDDATMQKIARELNLSETTDILIKGITAAQVFRRGLRPVLRQNSVWPVFSTTSSSCSRLVAVM